MASWWFSTASAIRSAPRLGAPPPAPRTAASSTAGRRPEGSAGRRKACRSRRSGPCARRGRANSSCCSKCSRWTFPPATVMARPSRRHGRGRGGSSPGSCRAASAGPGFRCSGARAGGEVHQREGIQRVGVRPRRSRPGEAAGVSDPVNAQPSADSAIHDPFPRGPGCRDAPRHQRRPPPCGQGRRRPAVTALRGIRVLHALAAGNRQRSVDLKVAGRDTPRRVADVDAAGRNVGRRRRRRMRPTRLPRPFAEPHASAPGVGPPAAGAVGADPARPEAAPEGSRRSGGSQSQQGGIGRGGRALPDCTVCTAPRSPGARKDGRAGTSSGASRGGSVPQTPRFPSEAIAISSGCGGLQPPLYLLRAA